MIEIRVYGQPYPKGSKSGFVVKGRAVLVDANPKTKPWEEAVKQAALDVPLLQMLDAAVEVNITFWLPRPKSIPKRRIYPSVMPDLDKLTRSVYDPLVQASVIRDDALIVRSYSEKLYASERRPMGCLIRIEEIA